ncbi:helix-turn-helix domain-containing protein [Blastococcus sp. SYSU DS0617]
MYREWVLPRAEVRCAWAVAAETGGTWVQPATEFWGLGFTATARGRRAEFVGPTARPRAFEMAPGDRFWGVEFEAYAFLRGVAKEALDVIQALPSRANRFTVGAGEYEIPDEDHLGDVVEALVADGLLAVEPSVRTALSGAPASDGRTLRRRVREVTALNRQQIAGMERAREAFRLLSEGVGIPDVVERAGYSDQAHLTRSLRALAGRTPGQILSGR